MKKYETGIVCGSFDVIHPGYIRLFSDAKTICCELIVALQSDPTIDRPEKCKPVQSVSDRIEILSAIKYIDKIVTYETEKDLDSLLGLERYDVRILGTDYIGRTDYTGSHYGKPVFYHEREHNYSTTKLKMAIANSVKKD